MSARLQAICYGWRRGLSRRVFTRKRYCSQQTPSLCTCIWLQHLWGYVGFEVLTAVFMECFIIWDITLCTPLSLLPASCLGYSLALKMEATCSSETPVDFQRTTRRYIPDRTLHLWGTLQKKCLWVQWGLLRNACWLSTDYTALCLRRCYYVFIIFSQCMFRPHAIFIRWKHKQIIAKHYVEWLFVKI
jgi:hypothetical protein